MHISPTGNGQDLDNIQDQQVADCEIRHWKEHVVGTANDMGYDNACLDALSDSEDDRKKALAFSIETLIRDLQEIGGQGPAVNKHKVIALLTKFPFSDMVQKFSKFIKTLLRKVRPDALTVPRTVIFSRTHSRILARSHRTLDAWSLAGQRGGPPSSGPVPPSAPGSAQGSKQPGARPEPRRFHPSEPK